MCFKTVSWLLLGCLLLVGVGCETDEHVERVEREDADSSESFGNLFNNFLAGLFGGASNENNKADAADKLNASTIEELKEFLSNITQSVTDNVTESEQSQSNGDASQQANSDGTMGLNAPTKVNSTVADSQSGDGTLPGTNTSGTTGVNAAIEVDTVVPNAQSNDEPLSQANDEGAPDVNTASTLVTPTTMTTLSTWGTTTVTYSPPEDDNCYTESALQDFCSVSNDLTDVSFWDIYSLMFSETVLSALRMHCPKGTWCLEDRFDYWNSLIDGRVDMIKASQISTSMCAQDLRSCLLRISDNYANCSTYLPMLFTAEALPLICDLKRKDMTETCYKHVVTALHVTLADIVRGNKDYDDDTYDDDTYDTYDDDDYDDAYGEDRESRDTCSTPEAEMTKALLCVTNSCPGEADTFNNFKPWGWFTSIVDDLIVGCDLDPDKCLALIQPPSAYQMASILAVSVSMAALTFTVIATWICYKRYRHNTVIKDGYQKLLNEGDES